MHVLSTPPAFILSQDQTLMLKFWFQSKFAWLILTVITVVLVLFWMFSWTSRLNQKPLFLEFSGFYILFSFQGSLLLSHRQLIYIIISNWLCQQLFYFIFNLSQKPVCVSALISSIDLPLSQGRMLWYQSFQGLSTIFLYLLFFLFCCDFLEYSKKSQQNKKNNKYRKIVDNPWKLWYHNIRPWDKGKSIEEIRAETQTGFWERLKIK